MEEHENDALTPESDTSKQDDEHSSGTPKQDDEYDESKQDDEYDESKQDDEISAWEQGIDHFQVGVAASKTQIVPKVIDSFLTELFLIEQHHPDTSEEIQSCVRALRKPNVTILDLLIACFVINKGPTLKYWVQKSQPDDLADFERLLDNIDDD